MKVVVIVPEIVAIAAICQAYGLDLWPIEKRMGKAKYAELVRDYMGMNGESCVQDHIDEYAAHLPTAKYLTNKYFR